MLPTFICIGPGRSATTMLYEAFKEHPDICMAKNTKETNYFNDEYHRGLEWYQSFFKHCQGKTAIGEISTTYIYDPEVPARIAGLLPDVKLITVLRNPFDRIRSAHGYRQRAGEIDARMDLEEAIKKYPELITQNYYGDQLKRYLEHFPEKNILIAFYDDLEQDVEKFIQTIFTFIGVDDSFIPKSIYKRINPSVAVRHRFLASVVRLSADTLRRWQLYYLLDRAKNASVLRRLLFRPRKTTTSQTEQKLNDILLKHFSSQIKDVELITGRTLTHWNQQRGN